MFSELTMASALARAARLYPEHPAILDTAGDLTWTEYVARIARAASVLRSLGLEPGQRFGILSHNSVTQAELINAGYWAGIVPVPINYRLAPSEIGAILNDAECQLLTIEDRFAPVLADPALAPWRDRLLHCGATPAGLAGPSYPSLREGATALAMHPSAPDDDAILLYTGGTTGRSKGVRLSHGNTIANGIQIALAIGARTTDRFLHALPMFHSADLFGTAFTLVGGAHAYIEQFTPNGLLEAVARHRITVLSLGPTVVIMTLQGGDFATHDVASVRLLFYGSAPMAVEWIRRTMERFPRAGLQQSYGLTETSPILTTLIPEQHLEAIATGRHELLRSVGRPVLGVELRIVDDQGQPVPPNTIGEVVVRGPNVTKGYLGLPALNAEVFRHGWFHTGDAGYLDEQHNLFLKDRIKDMIITGGENVYCTEVEAALYRHPAVSEVAVVGVPDERWGEAVFAVIVPAGGQPVPSEQELIDHCRQHIGGYKIPRRMAFVEALPKSAMGKILKNELRQTYGQ
ncbi:MAG: AMP-binding protein [Gammaproteobacteria bacterium]|nr:AMP-binding protein [Gammaproteobacteria bacterium]